MKNFAKNFTVGKILFFFLLFAASTSVKAQKIEGIYFNLYTDSLKKGFYNYINIDGKYSDGTWLPLDSNSITLTANTGYFKGNDLFIDSTYFGETVTVKATLKNNPTVWKEVTIYIRKRGFDEPLKTDEEILDEMRKKPRKPKQFTAHEPPVGRFNDPFPAKTIS